MSSNEAELTFLWRTPQTLGSGRADAKLEWQHLTDKQRRELMACTEAGHNDFDALLRDKDVRGIELARYLSYHRRMRLEQMKRSAIEKRKEDVRANMARMRERRKLLGLVRLELWVRPEHVEAIRRSAKRIAGDEH